MRILFCTAEFKYLIQLTQSFPDHIPFFQEFLAEGMSYFGIRVASYTICVLVQLFTAL